MGDSVNVVDYYGLGKNVGQKNVFANQPNTPFMFNVPVTLSVPGTSNVLCEKSQALVIQDSKDPCAFLFALRRDDGTFVLRSTSNGKYASLQSSNNTLKMDKDDISDATTVGLVRVAGTFAIPVFYLLVGQGNNVALNGNSIATAPVKIDGATNTAFGTNSKNVPQEFSLTLQRFASAKDTESAAISQSVCSQPLPLPSDSSVSYDCVTGNDVCRLYDTAAGFYACRQTCAFARSACAGLDAKSEADLYTKCDRFVAGTKMDTCNGWFSNAKPNEYDVAMEQACDQVCDAACPCDDYMYGFCNKSQFKSRPECACVNMQDADNKFGVAFLNSCCADGTYPDACPQANDPRTSPCTYAGYLDYFRKRYGDVITDRLFSVGSQCWWPPCKRTDQGAWVPNDPAYDCKFKDIQACFTAVTASDVNDSELVNNINNNCSIQNVYYDPSTKDIKTNPDVSLYGCDAAAKSAQLPFGKALTREEVLCAKCINGVCTPLPNTDGTVGTYADVATCVASKNCKPDKTIKNWFKNNATAIGITCGALALLIVLIVVIVARKAAAKRFVASPT